jgi:2-polyprenyl-3-methyl-5-hydroxy-6-metoxy-1,4-benzoquinol methylase
MSDQYYSEPRAEIRALVAARGARVLDVGCGSAALAASLKADGAEYVAGVELNGPAAEVARTRVDRLVEGSIVDAELPFGLESFDYVIFADVLEHLADPDTALQRCMPLLKGGGHVIVSVPNWRFYTVLLRLILDRWEYTNAGVRDRTHLRVFTRHSLLRFLEANDLELVQLNRNRRLIEDQSQIGRFGAVATRLSNATLGRWVTPELLTYQYVALARKPQ